MFIKVNKHFFCMIAFFIPFSIGVDKPMFKNSCFTFSFMFINCFGGFWAWVCDSSSYCGAIEGKFLTLSLFLHLHHFLFQDDSVFLITINISKYETITHRAIHRIYYTYYLLYQAKPYVICILIFKKCVDCY